jgi:hypothetical protein
MVTTTAAVFHLHYEAVATPEALTFVVWRVPDMAYVRVEFVMRVIVEINYGMF